AGIVFNLGLLFYFKYYDFFVENLNHAFHTDFTLKHILLPLGISFFTFQQLSFIIDRGRGRAEHYSFINYITFVTFFPQLIA
ncbi:MBOAT family protein, partial [Klebsiella oxytoca]